MIEIFDKSMYPSLVNNPDLLYFDHAATSPVHQKVLNAMNRYYETSSATAGRGEYDLAEQSLLEIDLARGEVAQTFGVAEDQVMFTSGATEGLNTVARWFHDAPCVIISQAEHNANIVPWLAQGRNIHNKRLRVIEVHDRDDQSTYNSMHEQINSAPQGSFVSINLRSNVTGNTFVKIRDCIKMAKERGFRVCVDASQTQTPWPTSFSYCPDFLVFSAHKLGGPKGVGVLIIRDDPEKYAPRRYGGGGVLDVSFSGYTPAHGIDRHEPGTPDIANIIGLGATMRLYQMIDHDEFFYHHHDQHREFCREIEGKMVEMGFQSPLRWLDNNIASYIPPAGITSADVAHVLSRTNLAVRTGRLCAHPYVDKIAPAQGIVRFSWGNYTTLDDFIRAGEIIERTLPKLIKEKQ